MGLWDWVMGMLLGDQNRSAPSTHREYEAPTQTSTAVLERPTPSTQTAADTIDDACDEDFEGLESDPPWWEFTGEEPLITLAEPTRPELSHEAIALENMLLEQFNGHDLDLPRVSNVPEKVLRHLSDPKCDFEKIARDISEDQVIAAAVLRMASSPMYRGAQKISALKPALTRLGTQALRALMYNQTLRQLTLQSENDENLARYVLQRSMASACIMQALAERVGIDREEAFLLGLMHDIGYVVVLREAVRQRRFVKYPLDLDTFEFLCHETHQEFGELLADSWSLPDKVKNLIMDHHRYPAEDEESRTERLLLQTTDIIISLLGYAPAKPYDFLNSRPVQDLGLDQRPDFMEFLADLPDRVDGTLQYL
jgi:putative nucleotidyltransferase with HDIG domain